ncbi:MAG: 4Fe-4S ferredoxin [candidate division KSB1 bacterium]|nr:4Fe-4S ferredoxin [candidate division KSB1 bacterium]
MRRKIIHIDEALCNGCGNCIIGCSEGALQLIDGKAKLVKEDFCDGFGDCIGTCPTGALTIEERDAVDFDETAVKEHLLATQGIEAVWRMEEAQQRHTAQQADDQLHLGCPGSRMREMTRPATAAPNERTTGVTNRPSQLGQWPVQIHLVPPNAPFFKGKELVVMSTCGPLALADVHERYLQGRSVVVGCPKLDNTSPYVGKLAAILAESSIPRVIVARMEVPCCGGLTMIVQAAVERCGRNDIIIQEDVLGIDGEIKTSRVRE